MTIKTTVQLACDIGLKCTKQIACTMVGPDAGASIREWARAKGWGSYGQRDACPACWQQLHSATERDPDEDIQAAIDGERGG